MSREKTREEIRSDFLDEVWSSIDYWEHEDGADNCRSKLEGLAFSLLCTLDGCAGFPACDVTVTPHPDDRKYREDNDEDFFPELEFGGALHEAFYRHPWSSNTAPVKDSQ